MFRKAERRQAKLRLALCGPSGSGKTFSALLIAQGLAPGGQIALIDTERGSGELYADLTPYDVAPLSPPFTPARYVELVQQAEQDGYDVLIIDSLSHAWSGDGGILDLHDKATAASRSGNSFMAWREVTPKHNQLVDTLLGCNLHVIVTMRTKTAYDLVEDNGKKKPVKIGLAPVQRDGLEYEFTTVMDLAVDSHVATATKDRTQLFDGEHFVPTVATGEALRAWLDTGSDPVADSKKALRSLKAAVSKIKSVPQLNQWWRQQSAQIARLTPADLEALTEHCGDRKLAILEREAIAAEGQPSKKGNSRRQPQTSLNDAEPDDASAGSEIVSH
ncbi:AAA family ATPase [Thiorhodococcus mannitoliphagus]|uniref:AAA family ATPase n=1 Tax=Thiorhodococcus mannitoliphagus TaxID=329406 RepID=A0A6P1DNT6_9GAMM|nr:ATP-binding protein [Thiorhodococcus mannitoliphagus]NEX19907.1 AAA family ATPase [Thiorhodococcus mannitoliphagus]